jgi:hypothetical protein
MEITLTISLFSNASAEFSGILLNNLIRKHQIKYLAAILCSYDCYLPNIDILCSNTSAKMPAPNMTKVAFTSIDDVRQNPQILRSCGISEDFKEVFPFRRLQLLLGRNSNIFYSKNDKVRGLLVTRKKKVTYMHFSSPNKKQANGQIVSFYMALLHNAWAALMYFQHQKYLRIAKVTVYLLAKHCLENIRHP